MLEWYQEPYGWDTALTILGIVIAFGGAIFVTKVFPNITAKTEENLPQANYIPHHIDQQTGDVVMINSDHIAIDIRV